MKITVISEKTGLVLLYTGLTLIFIAVILFLWADHHFDYNSPIDIDRFAKFGSFLGGVVGCLWTLASVILFYVTLMEQRESSKESQKAVTSQIQALNKQLDEFAAQRKEMELTRKVSENQSKTLKTQQFESNFYALLNIYLTIKNNLNSQVGNHDYFLNIYNSIKQSCVHVNMLDQHHVTMVAQYEKINDEHIGHLSHYFKSFYRIVKIIDSYIYFNDEEKIFYAKILRSQITDYENLILYYNSQSSYGTKSRELVLKYNLLKHTPLFYKPPFISYLELQSDRNIILFADRLNQFLIKHLIDFYDLDFESDRVEEPFSIFNCIVGIYFTEHIEIKVFLNRDIKVNGINLTEDQFAEFLYLYIYDKLVLDGFLSPDEVEVSKFKTQTDENLIFGILIKTEKKLNLNHDIY